MGKTQHRLTGPLSNRLRQAREDADLTRPQLSEATGISERTIAYYEDPTYTRNRKTVFVKPWAEACGRTYEEIAGKPGREVSRRACNGGNPFLGATSHPARGSDRMTRVPVTRLAG